MRGELLAKCVEVELALARLREDAVGAFFFLDMVLDLFLEHVHLGVEEFVVGALVRLDFGDQELGGVMLDIAFLELVLLDRAFACRIEDRLFDIGMDGQLEADLVRQLLLASVALGAFEFLEQLLDVTMILFEKRDCVLDLPSDGLPLGLRNGNHRAAWMFLLACVRKLSQYRVPTGLDWKAVGYLVSIVSVFFLGRRRVGEGRTRLAGIIRCWSSGWRHRSSAWAAVTWPIFTRRPKSEKRRRKRSGR